jgi:dipeptidyl aminopeptidase/acylaminoacyl peptidase
MRAAHIVVPAVFLSVALFHSAGPEAKERLLHVPGCVVLLGYPGDDTLYVAADGEELTLQPPGSDRTGHNTHPSLSRDAALVATSYVKSRSPDYREGIATYSLIDRRWTQYDTGDFHFVLSTSLSPDRATLAFEVERHWSQPQQLLLLDLKTGHTTVLIEKFLGSGPITWSPDGRRIAYAHLSEIRIREIGTEYERTLASGSSPAWSPSGELIAYLDDAGAVAVVRPDGKGATALVRLPRRLPWFSKRNLSYGPVWSPDSTALLLHEAADDETGRAVIHQFDLASGQLQRKRGKGVAVLGWVRSSAAGLVTSLVPQRP